MNPHFLLILKYAKRHFKAYVAGIFFIILTNWISVNVPVYIQEVINFISLDTWNNFNELWQAIFPALLTMFLLAMSMIVTRVLSRSFIFNTGRLIECEIKNDCLAKLSSLNANYYQHNTSGQLISRINNDISSVRLICGFVPVQIVTTLSVLSLTPVKMVQISWELTLYTVIPIVLSFVLSVICIQKMMRFVRGRMKELQTLSSFTSQAISGVDVIRQYRINEWASQKFQKSSRQMLQYAMKVFFLRNVVLPFMNNLDYVLKALIILLGGTLVIRSELTLGELTAFLAYISLLTVPLTGVGWMINLMQQGFAAIESLGTILNQEPEVKPLPLLENHHLIHAFDHGLQVKNLSFAYPNSPKILQDVSFEILPGQMIGILGAVGSGKTTLANCLNRYLPVADGMLAFGQHDLNHLDLTDVRNVIRTVSQNPFLFSDTVANNVYFGLKDGHTLSDEEFENILYESALSQEISNFPEREQTLIGERGMMLSGGQKQRLSLARAFSSSCDLLILDNVLSAVDYETERFLLEQIHKQKYCRSLLIISHRINAFTGADLILTLQDGRITEKGTHEELIQNKGYYYETFILQNS